MNQVNNFISKVLTTFGFLNDDQKVSLTNLTVMTFLLITGFRSLFGGAVFTVSDFKWTVQEIDFSSTLPLLFALINYSAKRTTLTNSQNIKDDQTNAKGN